MTRIFAKDVLELAGRPFLGLWLLLVPLCLIYVAGNSNIYPTQVRVLIENAPSEAKPSPSAVHDLAKEFSEIAVVPLAWDGADTANAMARSHAQMAVGWNGNWRVFMRPNGGADRERLVALAYQLAVSLGFGKPWQVKFAEAGLTENDTSESTVEDPHLIDLRSVATLEVIDLGTPSVEPNGVLISRVIALTIAFLPFLIASSTMAREWENGTLATLLVAPRVGWWGIIGGKILVALFATTICFFCMLIVTFAFFDIPARLDFGPIFVVQLLAMTTSAILGLAASALIKSQFQVYFLSALYIFCLIFLTGIVFPISGAALPVQVVAKALPLTFSLTPLNQWLVHGLPAWPYGDELYWLAGQSLTALVVMVLSASLARRKI